MPASTSHKFASVTIPLLLADVYLRVFDPAGRATTKKAAPEKQERPFPIQSRRRPTFPHSYPCSIIGPARLNFRVRDGNGCDPRGLITGNL
jgi:hypothetical protein